MLEKLFIGAFGKIMVGLVVVLLGSNIFSCYEKKSAQQQLITAKQEIALVRADNHNLANQLENAQIQIQQYQAQVKALHQNVLNKLQQAEQRSDEIMQQLEKHQTWSSQPVPTELGKLFNQRDKSADKTHRTFMPNATTLPTPKATNSH